MTAKDEINRLRKIYFACARKLGLDDDTRHAMNLSVTGGRTDSTKRFTLGEWRAAAAELQRRTGMEVEPGRPHVRHTPSCKEGEQGGGSRPPCSPPWEGGQDGSSPNDLASAAQIAEIERLRAEVHWRSSFDAFVRKRILSVSPLRAANWTGKLEDLFKAEATKVILALRKMARHAA